MGQGGDGSRGKEMNDVTMRRTKTQRFREKKGQVEMRQRERGQKKRQRSERH